MNDFNNLIKNRRIELGLTQLDIAKATGVSEATVSRWESGQISNMRRSKIAALAKVLQLSPSAVMDIESDPAPALPANAQPMPNFVKKPRLGVIACGEPILADQNIQSYDDIPDWVKCDFTLVCKGDSMVGAHIMDGAVVCIRSQPEVEDGQIAAVIVDDMESEATLKRVKYFPDHIELRPENPSFRPLSFWDEDMNKVRVIGKAVYCINTL